ncbi:sensor histidine kinase [Streptomyces sp. MI02-7b]|uniref:sensor histidine kinase n=1 Tax=Streptomyces sp. MI02-7b TaxID=462941 RepID=UPI0029A20A37|nr:sensor histidine kinase [Streptomyces sp. MI02-7b]MDX3071904.1 sensor histidine kinase [Streptomyces sp. MI02-7b]
MRNKVLADVALAVAFTAASMLLGHEQPPPDWHRLDAAGYALTALVNLPVAARRRFPVGVSVFVCVAWVVFVAAGYWPVVNSLAPLMALYTVATVRPARLALGCAALTGGVWVYAGLTAAQSSMATVVAQALVFPLVMCLFGHSARVSAQRAERLGEVTERLRAERKDAAKQAVAEEQARIARELHDVVAHHMSVISVQAGMASYVFASEPESARKALDTISDTTREALQEMRRMLKVLRAGPGEPEGGAPSYDPMPSVTRMGEMIERVRAAGLAVELRIEGSPRPVAPGVGLCAYRVVQEALTNVLKHAPHARARVLVAYEPHQLRVTVTDDGGGAGPHGSPGRSDPDTIPQGAGHGLIGMRERARLYGGTVDIGPLGDGFEVRLTLPTSARGAARRGDSLDA